MAKTTKNQPLPDARFATREEWLTAAVEELRPFFNLASHPVARSIRVTCGFPSNYRRSRLHGECWASTASRDGTYEIMVSPTLADPIRVFATLVEQMTHTVAGAMGLTSTYRQVATDMLLLPDAARGWKQCSFGEAFIAAYVDIIDSLGPYPHAELDLSERKTQSTRLLKAVCPSCGYTVRLTAKWAVQALPVCGIDGDTFNIEE